MNLDDIIARLRQELLNQSSGSKVTVEWADLAKLTEYARRPADMFVGFMPGSMEERHVYGKAFAERLRLTNLKAYILRRP